MNHKEKDYAYCKQLLEGFYPIGALTDGGVTRLGYTPIEDQMHQQFIAFGKELGLSHLTDKVGNTYVCNSTAEAYYLIGSHLDSVVEGGRYDGVAGVVAGLMVMAWAKEEGVSIPIRVGAFRCEESSNFGCCTIGSGLITKELQQEAVQNLTSKTGEFLETIFAQRGYTLNPPEITGIKTYLELHIEQGRVLEAMEKEVGIVTTIAAPRRFTLEIGGLAEHSGATPMALRSDALCSAAEVILAVQQIGITESSYGSVATVGVVENHPNVLNVIPGRVTLGIDLRSTTLSSLDRMEEMLKAKVEGICQSCTYEMKGLSSSTPVALDREVITGLEKAAYALELPLEVMPSGAGHDAMAFAPLCKTGMVFIPCKKGISHNKLEETSIESICTGARVLYAYLKDVTFAK